MTIDAKKRSNKSTKGAPRAHPAAKPGKAPRRPAKAPAKPVKRSKADEVVAMLQRPDGATIAELTKRFGVLPHSMRATISVESRKRGLKVELVGKAHYRLVD